MNSKKKKEASADQDASDVKKSGGGLGVSISTNKKNEGVEKPSRMSDMTSDFVKDYRKAEHSGIHDMNLVNKAMRLLIQNEGPLDPFWADHELAGDWKDHRELHVKGDLLLIYTLRDQPKGFGQVVFVRLGSHASLFG